MVSWLYFSTVSPCWFHNTPANRGAFFSRRILFTQSGLLPTSTALKDRLGLGINLRSWLIMQRAHSWWLVSGLDATGKTPMYEMPLIYVFGIWGLGFGVGASIFCIGVLDNGILSLTFCPEIMMVLWIDPKSSYHTFSMLGKWPKVEQSPIEL